MEYVEAIEDIAVVAESREIQGSEIKGKGQLLRHQEKSSTFFCRVRELAYACLCTEVNGGTRASVQGAIARCLFQQVAAICDSMADAEVALAVLGLGGEPTPSGSGAVSRRGVTGRAA